MDFRIGGHSCQGAAALAGHANMTGYLREWSTAMADGTGRIQGRVALITGGASGIGKATARLFLAERAKVVIADINSDALDQALADLRAPGHDVVGVSGDVRSMQDAGAMVRTAVDSFGSLDILFCNAGITSVMPISELTE